MLKKWDALATVCTLAVLFALSGPAIWAKGPGGSGGSGGSTGGGGGSTGTTVDVTSVIYDFGADGSQLLMKSDDFFVGGSAAYSATLNANVISQIDDTGRWFFYLNGQTSGVRTIWITPNEATDGSIDFNAPPADLYWKNVEAHSQCFDSSLKTIPFQSIQGSSTNCTLSLDFNWNGTVYKLHMSPQAPAGGTPAPATGVAIVTCNARSSDGSQCVNWTITPNMNAPNATVANLYSYGTYKGKAVWTFKGQHLNTFRIDVTNP